MVNHPQVEQSLQGHEEFERTAESTPVIRHFELTAEFLDVVGACHAFVAATNRVVPGLRGRALCTDEQVVLAESIARVWAALGWIEHAAETCDVDMGQKMTRLLQGE